MKKHANYEAEVVFDDPSEIEGFYVSFKDEKGRTKYVPCSEEFFHEYRNLERKLEREETKDIYYDAYYPGIGWVRTKEPPKYDDGHTDLKIVGPESLDYMRDEYDYEVANPDDESDTQVIDKKLLKQRVEIALSDFSHREKKIFTLSFYENKTDIEIARFVFKDESKRATVQRKRTEVYNAVVNFLKKFY